MSRHRQLILRIRPVLEVDKGEIYEAVPESGIIISNKFVLDLPLMDLYYRLACSMKVTSEGVLRTGNV